MSRLFALILVFFMVGEGGSEYKLIATCLCPGYEVLIKCIVPANGATRWEGTYFEHLCADGPIFYLNSNSSQRSRTCNGDILMVAADISMDGTLSSVLMVNLSEGMQRKTIECVHHNGTEKLLIGATQFLLNAYLPSPTNIVLFNVSREQLTFTWSPVSHDNCSDIYYNIIASLCANCPETTVFNSVTCKKNYTTMLSHVICTFAVQTVVCDGILGRPSEPIAVPLRGPSPPISIILRMFHNRSLNILFNETHQSLQDSSCLQSNFIHDTVISYTVSYFDTSSRIRCGSETIPASSCINGSCIKTSDLSILCPNSTSVSLSVYATNTLGDGRESDPVIVVLEDHTFKRSLDQSTSSITTILYSVTIPGIVFLVVLVVVFLVIKWFKKLKPHTRRSIDQRSAQATSYIQSSILHDSYNVVINQQSMRATFATTNADDGNNLGIYSVIQNCSNDDDHEMMKEPNQNRISEHNEPSGNFDLEQGGTDTQDTVIYENNFHEIDTYLNLDNLLIQIRRHVTPKWYQFGLIVGINKETLDQFSNLPPEEYIVEMLDLWLRTSDTAITWRDVANALKQIGFHQLAENVLKIYKTGLLPNEVNEHPCNEIEMVASGICPPLPPKTYEITRDLIH